MFDFSHNDEFWTGVLKARQAEAFRILRETDRRQGTGRGYQTDPSGGEPMYCVWGVLAEAAGIDPRSLPWNSMTDHYEKVADLYGLFGASQVMMKMNDAEAPGMSFREIADEMERRFSATWAKDPGIFLRYLESNHWIKPRILEAA